MRKLIAGRLTYANVTATLALFFALGGGAWAVGKSLVSSSGALFGCVRARGGVLRIVKEGARCHRGQVSVALATPTYVALHPRPGPRGRRGRRGAAGARGPAGPAGTQGPQGLQGPGAYAFSLRTGSGPEQTVASNFAGNQMRLVCGVNKCKAQVLIGGAVDAWGIDTRGPANEPVATTNTVESETPTQMTLTAIEGKGLNESQGTATVSLPDGSAWQLQVELTTDGSGNVRLIGTAVKGSATSQFLL